MSLKHLWKLPDLRRQFAITLLAVAAYRLASHIPLPGISADALAKLPDLELSSSGLFQFADLVAGGAISRASIVALSIYPFLTAYGVLGLLTPIFPRFGEWQRTHREAVPFLRMGVTLILAIAGAVGSNDVILPQMGVGFESVLQRVTAVFILTTGAMLTTWLAWWIGADGLGMGGYANGINVIVLTNILAAGPRSLLFLLEAGALRFALVLLALALLALPVLIVQGASRRVPVQYARRVTPRRTMMHSPHSYIPFPVVPGGLDAIEMVYAIATVGALAMQVIRTWVPALAAPLESLSAVTATAPPGLPLREVMGALGMFLGVVLMTMLQASTNFEEADYARDLQRAGGMIPNVRSGEPTRNYLARIVGRLSLAGAVIMGLFSILPWLLQWALGLPQPVYMAWAVWTICRILTDYIKGIEAELSMYGYRDDILIK